jgi:hypothetical protein
LEIRRILAFIMAFILISTAVVTFSPQPALAWDNADAHMVINKLAIDLFLQRAQTEPQLKDFKGVRFDGAQCWGMAWDPADGTSKTNRIPSVKRQKTLINWIVDGGFSADEPEGPMAMRHFYDPVKRSFLTDMDFIGKLSDIVLHTVATNPQISAVDWANDKDEGLGERDIMYKQDYSFPDAKRYFREAVESTEKGNLGYGNAWRAVGETMHLIADMGLAPHVRNDGHGLFDKDYVENNTLGSDIRKNFNTNWTRTIDYTKSIPELMHDMAAYTNKNFFSQDTIAVQGQTTNANGLPAYQSPVIANVQGGYAYHTVDGVSVKSAAVTLASRFSLSNKTRYSIDEAVMKDQQHILTPTIVRASQAVLERFLPRFQVQASLKPDPDVNTRYIVNGMITLVPSAEWKERLTIRNGAYVSVAGKIEAVTLITGDNLNDFTFTISGKPGDEVKVIYDLGGYVIESPAIKITELTIDPPALSAETNKDYTFTARADNLPANATYRWSVNSSVQQTSASNIFKTKFTSKGEYTIWAALLDSKGQEIAKASSKVTVKEAITPTTPTTTGYWQYKGTWNTEIAKNDPKYPNMTWEASASDGAVKATMKMRDMSVDSHPWLEFTYDYSWSVNAKNGNFKEKLYPGDEITVNMTLNYKGCDPAKLSRGATMYCGAFNNYPSDNAIKASNPTGAGKKSVMIPITAGLGKGATSFIKVHCEGGAQGIEYAYLYEWVTESK